MFGWLRRYWRGEDLVHGVKLHGSCKAFAVARGALEQQTDRTRTVVVSRARATEIQDAIEEIGERLEETRGGP